MNANGWGENGRLEMSEIKMLFEKSFYKLTKGSLISSPYKLSMCELINVINISHRLVSD